VVAVVLLVFVRDPQALQRFVELLVGRKERVLRANVDADLILRRQAGYMLGV
jgi:hypothetical protein